MRFDPEAASAVAAAFGMPKGVLRGLSRRRFGALALGAAAAGAFTRLPVQAQPDARDVRVVDFDWLDTTRDRAVPARLYWPTAAAKARPVPLIVFSHGLGGSRRGYRYLGEGWSARGFASLHLQHVGSDQSVWAGNPLTLFDRLDKAGQEREAVERARDVTHGLDRLLDRKGPYHAAIDRTRIAAAGHSYGANTTLLVAGAQVVRNGAVLGYRDPRVGAGIVISAPPFYGETDLGAVLGAVAIPTLHVTATDDTIRLPGRFSPVQDRIDIFSAVPTSRKALVVFQGGSHSIFTDRSLTGGATLNPQVKQATVAVGLAFLDLAFNGDPAPLQAWTTAWKPILAAAPAPFPVSRPSGGRKRQA